MGLINLFRRKEDILETIFPQLNNPLQEIREGALDKLENLNLSIEQGLLVLEMAKNTFPVPEYEWQDISAQLIDICAKNPYTEYIDKVEAIYNDLNANAKTSVLHFLSTFESEKALLMYLRLLERSYEDLEELPTGNLHQTPRFPQLLFPRLLKFVGNRDIKDQIYIILLNYFNYDLVEDDILGEHKNTIIDEIRDMADKTLGYALKRDARTLWDDDGYIALRNRAGIYFDLAGYIKDPRIIEILKGLMGLWDMKLKMFAALSLLKHEWELQQEDIFDVAADNESRNYFYDSLVMLGREDIFPSKFKKQKYFAESNMTDWLAHPTELGRVPDKMELMDVFEEDSEEYYLFRFKCSGDEKNDWMAGVAGAFKKEDTPTTNAEGNTFSRFEEWHSKPPKEHYLSMIGNTKGYWPGLLD